MPAIESTGQAIEARRAFASGGALRLVVQRLATSGWGARRRSCAAVGTREDLEQVTVRILEVDAAPVVPVIDLTGFFWKDPPSRACARMRPKMASNSPSLTRKA
jgi:hypothetical protein